MRRQQRAPMRQSLVVRAIDNSNNNKNVASEIRSGIDSMLSKYDFLSTGMGALAVTTYCVVYRHQDPLTALQITASSVIAALVLNEVLFEDQNQ